MVVIHHFSVFIWVKGENFTILAIYVIVENILMHILTENFQQKVDFEKLTVPFQDVGYREKSSLGTIFRHDKNRLIIPPVLQSTVFDHVTEKLNLSALVTYLDYS